MTKKKKLCEHNDDYERLDVEIFLELQLLQAFCVAGCCNKNQDDNDEEGQKDIGVRPAHCDACGNCDDDFEEA